jgi:hypothetical protein
MLEAIAIVVALPVIALYGLWQMGQDLNAEDEEEQCHCRGRCTCGR